jgi:RimJ/RimL family protein N-acetyltransferase
MKRLFFSKAVYARSQHDGSQRLSLRPITVNDRAAYFKFITKLSAQTKFQRALGSVKHPSATALTQLLSPDLSEQVVLGIFVRSGASKDRLSAVGRLARSDSTCDGARPTAEFAITVADEYQGEGMGTTLLKALTLEATKLGYGALVATTFADNEAMLALAARQGFAETEVPGDGTLRALYCALNVRTPIMTPAINKSIPPILTQSGIVARQR